MCPANTKRTRVTVADWSTHLDIWWCHYLFMIFSDKVGVKLVNIVIRKRCETSDCNKSCNNLNNFIYIYNIYLPVFVSIHIIVPFMSQCRFIIVFQQSASSWHGLYIYPIYVSQMNIFNGKFIHTCVCVLFALVFVLCL